MTDQQFLKPEDLLLSPFIPPSKVPVHNENTQNTFYFFFFFLNTGLPTHVLIAKLTQADADERSLNTIIQHRSIFTHVPAGKHTGHSDSKLMVNQQHGLVARKASSTPAFVSKNKERRSRKGIILLLSCWTCETTPRHCSQRLPEQSRHLEKNQLEQAQWSYPRLQTGQRSSLVKRG